MVSVRFQVTVQTSDFPTRLELDLHLQNSAGISLNPLNVMEFDGCILRGSKGDVCASSLDLESLKNAVHEATQLERGWTDLNKI